jgi:hypothetical protein
MRTTVVALAALVAGALLSGCATVTRGTTDTLMIQSEPSAAEVELSTGQTCRTPCSFELKRKRDLHVVMRKEGFQDADIAVESKVAGAGAAGMAGNVLIGGIIGVGVDAATGATKSLKPNPVHVHLVVKDPADADRLCEPPSTVHGAACRGLLRPGTTQDETQQLLGPPEEKHGSDDREWKYGHDTLLFDESGRLASNFVEK